MDKTIIATSIENIYESTNIFNNEERKIINLCIKYKKLKNVTRCETEEYVFQKYKDGVVKNGLYKYLE
jgi:hypothetical protein